MLSLSNNLLPVAVQQRIHKDNVPIIFGSAINGLILNPSDAASVFADTAGSVRALPGDPVALIRDLSGNGLHASQSVLSRRPMLREAQGRRYLEFDGIDDSLVVPAITAGSNKMQLIAGITRLSDSGTGTVVEFSVAGNTNPGAFYLRAPSGSAPNVQLSSRGTASGVATMTGAAAPQSMVVTGLADIAAPAAQIRRDGLQVAQSLNDQGSGNFGSYPLYIGARAGTQAWWQGHLYGLILRFGPVLTPAELLGAETWVSAKMPIL